MIELRWRQARTRLRPENHNHAARRVKAARVAGRTGAYRKRRLRRPLLQSQYRRRLLLLVCLQHGGCERQKREVQKTNASGNVSKQGSRKSQIASGRACRDSNTHWMWWSRRPLWSPSPRVAAKQTTTNESCDPKHASRKSLILANSNAGAGKRQHNRPRGRRQTTPEAHQRE